MSLNGRRETSTTMTTVAAATYVDAIDGGGKREVQQTANGDNSATDDGNNTANDNAANGDGRRRCNMRYDDEKRSHGELLAEREREVSYCDGFG